MNKFKKYLEESKEEEKKTITLQCNKYAFEELIPLLEALKRLGDMGASRAIKIQDENKGYYFDGDGPSKIFSINVN